MNTLWQALQHPLVRSIGWALLHSLWQGALIGLVFAAVRLAARRSSAKTRYLTGCVCLALALAGPVLTLRYSSGSLAASLPHSRVSASAPQAFELAGGHVNRESFPLGIHFSLLESIADFLGSLTPVLAGAWLLGVLFCLVRLIRGCWEVRQMRTLGNEPIESEWLERLNDLRLRLGISRPVRLLKSALVEVPTVIGWLRPVILLPAASLAGLAPEQLEAILAHELAHVRRLDYLVNAFQCIVETLMFYHPVVWWISRCVREERENCCDDLVLEVCEDRFLYARALAQLEASRLAVPELAFAASGGSLLKRIRRLVGAVDDDSRASTRELCGLALLGLGLLLIGTGFYLGLAPANFRAVTRIRVERNPESESDPRSGKAPSRTYDPYFIQTEFEVIQSDVILGKVVEDLNLNHAWGRKYANGETLKTQETIQLLKNRLDLRPIRNTSLIEITVSSENQDEATKIANKIAETYQQYRFEERQKQDRGGIQVLLDQQNDAKAKMKAAAIELDKLREALHINEVAEANAPAILMSAETLRRLESLRIETQVQVVGAETLLADLKQRGQDLGKEKLAQALPTAVQDLLLTGLLEQRTLAEQKLMLAEKDYGPDHPEVKKALIQVEDLKSKINERVDGILAGLEASLAALRKGLVSLESEVARAKDNDIRQASYSRPYFQAKHRLEELQEFNRILQMKIAEENIDFYRPKSIVAIVDRATPPLRPASPNRPLAASLIVLGLLLDGLGLVLVRSKRAPVPLTI